MEVEIRAAKPEDCKNLLLLIKELADYEGFGDRPKIDEKGKKSKMLIEDGFGDSPFYHSFVAELNDKEKAIVGFCLYFYTYSTWEGRAVYMEDLYVKKEFRKRGIGFKLWKTLAQEAVLKNCKRMDFAVLNWNQPSIHFYEKMGAMNQTKEEGWNLFRLGETALERLACEIKNDEEISKKLN
uniref:N-acetyltransferase domain-containing protein n=1 Tax=Strigamia maritima TaxID=126957 RepID=T1IZT4_STRMM